MTLNVSVVQGQEVADRVRHVVFSLANKLKDPESVESSVMSKNNLTMLGKINPWDPLTLSHGFPGTIMFFGELDRQFPDQGWDKIAHNHILYLRKYLQEGSKSISLFGGITGLAFSIWCVSKNGERYQNILSNIDSFIVKETINVLEIEKERQKIEKGVSPAFYDVIQGVTGIGRYLLERGDENSKLHDVLISILNSIIDMSSPIKNETGTIPAWYVSNQHQFLKKDKIKYPNGNYNLGLAHGMLGPISLLSLAYLKGIEVDKLRETIESMCEFILSVMRYDENGYPIWPHRLSFEEMTIGNYEVSDTRDGWCYGNSSVSRVLYLSGKALNNTHYQKVALNGFRGIVNRYQDEIVSPTYCHGKAGLLQCLTRMKIDTSEDFFDNQINALTNDILSQYDNEKPLGFYDIEELDGRRNHISKAGLLEGSSGVGLSLLSLSRNQEPVWDKVFLIS